MNKSNLSVWIHTVPIRPLQGAIFFLLLIISPFPSSMIYAQETASRVEYKMFRSEALDQDKRCAVYLPEGYDASDKSYPVIYFLHGLFGSEDRWEERGAKPIVDQLMADSTVVSAIIAIADGDNSFYVNAINGKAQYEDYIIEDFISFIESAYRVDSRRSHRAMSGISMGGFGSLMLGMKHPDLFSSISAHSAVLIPVPLDQLPPRLRESYQSQFFEAVFGNPVDEALWEKHHPIDLVHTATDLKTVAWYFDCGTEDRYGFYRGAAKLHMDMEASGIPHEYNLLPGGHGWEYVRTTLHRSLTFHSKHFQMAEE
jgi:S-formylglutathione hydrolase FrmB